MQKVVKHARREPNVPTTRIADLYGVNRKTLNRRVLGTHQDRSTAHRGEQLLSPGEERALADYMGTMADVGFPLSHKLLRQIAQDIVNERRGCELQGSEPQGPNPHTVGINWVNRFLSRNPGFKKSYLQYQERARSAASNDKELQADFLRKLDNLIRRKKIKPENLWNCDEKGRNNAFLYIEPSSADAWELGITMGRNSTRTMAIVRSGGRATAITEGSREFCSVLETVNAAGIVIPPFIVWQGKSHRESYYKKGGLCKATFAVSESGYMDDELGFEYMRMHFEPQTRGSGSGSRCLIVDGHSSHTAWKMVKYALDHDIHLICLPSKSTLVLQPLNVGCFGVLQTTYERNLSGTFPVEVVSHVLMLPQYIFEKTPSPQCLSHRFSRFLIKPEIRFIL